MTQRIDHTGLMRALAAEYAAVFAYGPIGVHLDGDDEAAARAAEDAHRDRRDALLLTLADRGVEPPVAAAAYQLPFPVAGAEPARELAILVEERVAASWRAVLPAVAGDDRASALAALVDAAVRATGWRLAAGLDPATRAFPGSPD
jgi:hypothetical protein